MRARSNPLAAATFSPRSPAVEVLLTALGDIGKYLLLVRRVALHRLDDVGDQVVPALQHDVDLRPLRVDLLVKRDDLVVAADRAATSDQAEHDQYGDKRQQNSSNTCVSSHCHTSRANELHHVVVIAVVMAGLPSARGSAAAKRSATTTAEGSASETSAAKAPATKPAAPSTAIASSAAHTAEDNQPRQHAAHAAAVVAARTIPASARQSADEEHQDDQWQDASNPAVPGAPSRHGPRLRHSRDLHAGAFRHAMREHERPFEEPPRVIPLAEIRCADLAPDPAAEHIGQNRLQLAPHLDPPLPILHRYHDQRAVDRGPSGPVSTFSATSRAYLLIGTPPVVLTVSATICAVVLRSSSCRYPSSCLSVDASIDACQINHVILRLGGQLLQHARRAPGTARLSQSPAEAAEYPAIVAR